MSYLVTYVYEKEKYYFLSHSHGQWYYQYKFDALMHS
jgi:hypothetical protein